MVAMSPPIFFVSSVSTYLRHAPKTAVVMVHPWSAVFPFWLALVDESLQPFFSVARYQVLDHECRSIPVLCRAFSLSRTGASAAIFAVGTGDDRAGAYGRRPALWGAGRTVRSPARETSQPSCSARARLAAAETRPSGVATSRPTAYVRVRTIAKTRLRTTPQGAFYALGGTNM